MHGVTHIKINDTNFILLPEPFNNNHMAKNMQEINYRQLGISP